MNLFTDIRYYLLSALIIGSPLYSGASDTVVNDRFDDIDVFMAAVEQTRLLEEAKLREAKVDDLISFAGSFLGSPYRRGGKGPKGFDCSGFTGYVFRHFDTSLAASSRAQYLQGEEIDSSDIRPGDLVFFSGRRSGKTVGHVGIAVDVDSNGRVKFIHAAHQGGIRIDSYPDGGYYSERFIGARRVI